tara:strand:- start:7581 stop:7844 length:264 start_codon:yes stop_codon:yes gene_type:complete
MKQESNTATHSELLGIEVNASISIIGPRIAEAAGRIGEITETLHHDEIDADWDQELELRLYYNGHNSSEHATDDADRIETYLRSYGL